MNSGSRCCAVPEKPACRFSKWGNKWSSAAAIIKALQKKEYHGCFSIPVYMPIFTNRKMTLRKLISKRWKKLQNWRFSRDTGLPTQAGSDFTVSADDNQFPAVISGRHTGPSHSLNRFTKKKLFPPVTFLFFNSLYCT